MAIFVYMATQHMESNALEKLTNNIVPSWFFARTLFRIRRIVKISDVVDRFLRKLFWFFQNIFSILGSTQLRISNGIKQKE